MFAAIELRQAVRLTNSSPPPLSGLGFARAFVMNYATLRLISHDAQFFPLLEASRSASAPATVVAVFFMCRHSFSSPFRVRYSLARCFFFRRAMKPPVIVELKRKMIDLRSSALISSSPLASIVGAFAPFRALNSSALLVVVCRAAFILHFQC